MISWKMWLCGIVAAASAWRATAADDAPEQNVQAAGGQYLIGTGIYDITGPAAQINLMGYANPAQTAHGILMRLRSRAFVISQLTEDFEESENDSIAVKQRRRPEEEDIKEQKRSLLRWNWKKSKHNLVKKNFLASVADPDRTVCFVSIDAGMGSDLLNTRVLKRLEDLLPDQGGKRLCHLENLSISGTHSHSGPAGFLQYALFQVTSLGFFEETMIAFAEGIAQSIKRAYDNLEHGNIEVASDFLMDASINRSPSSYLLNPQSERNKYADEGDTDKTMLMLKFISDQKKPLGALNWFAVHGTSMNNTNLLLNGDNKGYASYLMEKHFNGNDTLPGKGDFVAAFASSNLGDVSPNTNGAKCIDTGLPCNFNTSTCSGKATNCIAFGPGKDMFESTEIIGRKQFEHGLLLFQEAKSDRLSGEVSFRHSFIDMSNRNVTLENGNVVKTCPAALGYGFAGGTTDGPGDFDFTQGRNTSNPFWNMIGGFLSVPTKEQIECQRPKPILLNTGNAKLPYLWDPASVPISVFRVGRLFILSVPGELTTMAGRRLRGAIRALLVEHDIRDPVITIAGLANSYTHYVTTFEEYAGQRYEAASTLYGPNTLLAYIQEFERITKDLLDGSPSATDKAPDDLSSKQWTLVPPVEFDTIGIGKTFGSVAVDALDQYKPGVDSVKVSFRSANPRNNQRIEGTFLSVDHLEDDGSWRTVFVDGDWCTRFIWKGGLGHFGISFAEIIWDVPSETPQGLYRICHYGTRKTLLGDSENAFFHIPDWLLSNSVGSLAIGLLLQLARQAVSLSESLRHKLGYDLSRSRYKDFEGCTKTFLMTNQHEKPQTEGWLP